MVMGSIYVHVVDGTYLFVEHLEVPCEDLA
jgi:hypothetical protein